jgi:hypothetical protein
MLMKSGVLVLSVGLATACVGRAERADTVRADSARGDTVLADSGTRTSADECVRGEPEPALATSGRTARAPRFQRTGKLEAIEDAEIDDSTSLRISHGGCAHFAETYAFTIRGATRDSAEVAAWLTQGAASLRALDVVEDKKSQMDEMAKALETAATSKPSYVFGDPISVSEMVTITVVVRRVNNASVIEVLYNNTL